MSQISINRTQRERSFEPANKPPSDEAFMAMDAFETFTVLDDDSEPTEFGRNEMVLLIPHEEELKMGDGGNLQMDAYWKGKILDIRADSESEDEVVWVKVQWFYKTDHLKTVFPKKFSGMKTELLGRCELVMSNQTDIIEALTIESPCTIRYFDDRLVDLEQIDKEVLLAMDSEFSKGHNKWKACSNRVPGCSRRYAPTTNLQRYCYTCKKWFHIACMKDKHGVPLVPAEALTNDDDLRAVAMRPTERGPGVHGTVGNGLAQITAREMMLRDDVDWRDGLEADYVAYMLGSQPVYFSCVGCEGSI